MMREWILWALSGAFAGFLYSQIYELQRVETFSRAEIASAFKQRDDALQAIIDTLNQMPVADEKATPVPSPSPSAEPSAR